MSLIPKPRLRPSPPPPPPDEQTSPPLVSSSQRAMITTRKRKAPTDDDDDGAPENPTNLPRKLTAIAGPSQPNKPLRPATKAPPNGVAGPSKPAITRKPSGLLAPKPVPTTATAARKTIPLRTRATSAPPKNVPPPRQAAQPTTRPAVRATTRAQTSRTVSGPQRAKAAEEQRFQALQEQVTSIAADMDAERAKREELESNHHALLASTKTQELNQRRELDTALDEIEALKRKHANEQLDWETDTKRKERQIRELEEDVRLRDEDLERERDTVKALRTTVSQQATAQLTLSSQITALQAQVSAVQIALDNSTNNAAELALKLEAAERRIAEQVQEIRQAEMQRRKLHNLVQELKVRFPDVPQTNIPSPKE